MTALLKWCRAVDRLNAWIGSLMLWFILAMTLISAGNAAVRKVFDTSSNAWLEVQWYLFAWAFLLAAGYTLLHQEHVKIDVIYGRWSKRTRIGIDIFGLLVFLTPLCLTVLFFSVPEMWMKIQSGEMSPNAGGLVRWPVWVALPLGFALLLLQGWSELIKRIAFLQGKGPDPTEKANAKSDEERLAEDLRREAEAAAANAASAR
ncbi:MAG: TRAP transporter small permease subunit [Burkholderiales bacterium]|nr:TRAP transporter small permease subunit [Burkholderiales bacterium]